MDEERGCGDDDRARPAGDDHGGDASRGPVMDVVELRDGPVAVERDGEQVEDRRRAADEVERCPGVAHGAAEEPARTHLHARTRRREHDQSAILSAQTSTQTPKEMRHDTRYENAAWWRNGMASDLRSRGRGFDPRPGCGCVTTLGKLFTPNCLDADTLR